LTAQRVTASLWKLKTADQSNSHSGNDDAISFWLRDQLNPQRFQSMQFREIEFAWAKTGNILNEFRNDDSRMNVCRNVSQTGFGEAFYAALRRRGFDAPAMRMLPMKPNATSLWQRTQAILEILTHFEQRPEEFHLAELCWSTIIFSLWRSHHIKMVERMVGTKRAPAFRSVVICARRWTKIFPELWKRAPISTLDTASGCPLPRNKSAWTLVRACFGANDTD